MSPWLLTLGGVAALAAVAIVLWRAPRMRLRTDPDFRRTITTITFCGAGIALTPLLAWMTALVRNWHDDVFHLAIGAEILLGIVLIGLSFTVAMRQISGSILGNTFSASGGEDDDPPPPPAPTVVTTTKTEVQP